MRSWLPSRRMPSLAAAYLVVILASTAVMTQSLLMDDDATFAAIYIVMFAFPSSLLAMVPEMVNQSAVAGVLTVILLVVAGLFQVWLLWKAIVERRQRLRGFLD